ncbi:hypothetical protein ACFC0D_29025 [Streptomyces sp. NPDC056222]|uniref:hypothetical protein n=1 Tax=Streptomyces sp. NPDC056222 TaxID=3345749 RepID=UPI0035D83EA9
MSAFRRTLTSALSATVLAAGLALGAAAPARAASCPSSASPKIPGGKAHWTLSCRGGTLKVYGWVEDTRQEGDCANVSVWPGGGHHWKLVSACSWGERKNFDFAFAGTTTASVYLYLGR